MAEKSNVGSKHKQIKEDIVESILSSIYAPGDMIPTQEDYARRYNVSRLTVRKAIDDLIAKGILRTEKGRGTFVEEVVSNTFSFRRLAGFSSNVNSKKVKVTSRVIGIEEIPADKRLSVKLDMPEGSPVVHIQRLRYANGICASLQNTYLNKALVADVDFANDDLSESSLYELLETKCGIVLGFADEQFRAIRASEEVAAYFEIEIGDPVLYVKRVAFRIDKVPVEYCENFESSDVNGIWVKSLSI